MIVPWRHNPRYGQERSYVKGMQWLAPCALVEDWGCALAYAKNYRIGDYRGIDGTPGKADVVADLSTYRSEVEGIFMRHILEHNYDWRVILQNALASFTKRMTLILYRPMQQREAVILTKPVELDLPRDELMEMVSDHLIDNERIEPATHGYETMFYLEKARG
jgi:hypothetical protein